MVYCYIGPLSGKNDIPTYTSYETSRASLCRRIETPNFQSAQVQHTSEIVNEKIASFHHPITDAICNAIIIYDG